MSCNYAEGLSPYENKGKLGLPESWDPQEEVDRKVDLLARWVKEAARRKEEAGGRPEPGSGGTVFHTGAGVSTSAGIPVGAPHPPVPCIVWCLNVVAQSEQDFRGPKGVWTLEKKGQKPAPGVSWEEARPTLTHLAVSELCRLGLADFVVTQNIDGLHMRAGTPRERLAELHGNMFVDRCAACRRMVVRPESARTVGQKVDPSRGCPARRANGRSCRGRLADFVLDWEDELPDADLDLSDARSALASLNVVLGSTLQIVPAGNLPLQAKKYCPEARFAVVNLQPTKHDKKADLVSIVVEREKKVAGLD